MRAVKGFLTVYSVLLALVPILLVASDIWLGGRITTIEHTKTVDVCSTKACRQLLDRVFANAAGQQRHLRATVHPQVNAKTGSEPVRRLQFVSEPPRRSTHKRGVRQRRAIPPRRSDATPPSPVPVRVPALAAPAPVFTVPATTATTPAQPPAPAPSEHPAEPRVSSVLPCVKVAVVEVACGKHAGPLSK